MQTQTRPDGFFEIMLGSAAFENYVGLRTAFLSRLKVFCIGFLDPFFFNGSDIQVSFIIKKWKVKVLSSENQGFGSGFRSHKFVRICSCSSKILTNIKVKMLNFFLMFRGLSI